MDCFISISSLFTPAVDCFIHYIWPPVIPASESDRDFSYSTSVKESRQETGTTSSVETDLEKSVPVPIPADRTTSPVDGSSYHSSIGRLSYLEGYQRAPRLNDFFQLWRELLQVNDVDKYNAEHASYRTMHFFTSEERHLFCDIVKENKSKSLEHFLYSDEFHLSLFDITETIKLQEKAKTMLLSWREHIREKGAKNAGLSWAPELIMW